MTGRYAIALGRPWVRSKRLKPRIAGVRRRPNMILRKNELSIVMAENCDQHDIDVLSEELPKDFSIMLINYPVLVRDSSFAGLMVQLRDNMLSKDNVRRFIRCFKREHRHGSASDRGIFRISRGIVERYGISVARVPFNDTVTIFEPYFLAEVNRDGGDIVQFDGRP